MTLAEALLKAGGGAGPVDPQAPFRESQNVIDRRGQPLAPPEKSLWEYLLSDGYLANSLKFHLSPEIQKWNRMSPAEKDQWKQGTYDAMSGMLRGEQ